MCSTSMCNYDQVLHFLLLMLRVHCVYEVVMIPKTAKHGPLTCSSVNIDCASWSIHNTWQGQCQGHYQDRLGIFLQLLATVAV